MPAAASYPLSPAPRPSVFAPTPEPASPIQRQENPAPAFVPPTGIAAAPTPPVQPQATLAPLPATPSPFLEAYPAAAATTAPIQRQGDPVSAVAPVYTQTVPAPTEHYQLAAASPLPVQRQAATTPPFVAPQAETPPAAASFAPLQRQPQPSPVVSANGPGTVAAALPSFAPVATTTPLIHRAEESHATPAPHETPDMADEGEGLDDNTWQRLSYVMRTHQAMIASGEYQQLSEDSALPSFLSPVQRKQALQRRHDIHSNREANKRLTQPPKQVSRKPVQRATSVDLLFDPMAPAQSAKKSVPTAIPAIQRSDAAATPPQTTPSAPIAPPSASAPDATHALLPPTQSATTHTPITNNQYTNTPITNPPITHNPSPEASTNTPAPQATSFTMRTVAHQEQQGEAHHLARLMGQVAPAQATDSPVELVLPRTPRPQGTPLQRRPNEAKVNPREMVNTEIGALPSDLWAMMGETPPTSANHEPARGRVTTPALQRTPSPGPAPLAPEKPTDPTGFPSLSGLAPDEMPPDLRPTTDLQRSTMPEEATKWVGDSAAAVTSPVMGLSEPRTGKPSPTSATPPHHRQTETPVQRQMEGQAQTAAAFTHPAPTSQVMPGPSLTATPPSAVQRQTEDPVQRQMEGQAPFAAAFTHPAPAPQALPGHSLTATPPSAVQRQTESPVQHPTEGQAQTAAAFTHPAPTSQVMPGPSVTATPPSAVQRQTETPVQRQMEGQAQTAAAFTQPAPASQVMPGPSVTATPPSAVQRQMEGQVQTAAAFTHPAPAPQTLPGPSVTTTPPSAVQRQTETPVQRQMEGQAPFAAAFTHPAPASQVMPGPSVTATPPSAVQRQTEDPVQRQMEGQAPFAAAFTHPAPASQVMPGPSVTATPPSAVQRQTETPVQRQMEGQAQTAAAFTPPRAEAATFPPATTSAPSVQRQAETPRYPQPGQAFHPASTATSEVVAPTVPNGFPATRSTTPVQRRAEQPVPPEMEQAYHSAAATQHSASSPQHSVLSTQHSAPSTQHSAPSPQFSVLTPTPTIQRDLPITDTPDSSMMETVSQQMRHRRRLARGENEKRSKEITMVSNRAEAERNLHKPRSVLVKESDKDSGMEMFAERENLRGLKRHTREVPSEEFVPEKKEEDKPKVDIDQVSRQVYQQIRHRLTQEWEQRRARMG